MSESQTTEGNTTAGNETTNPQPSTTPAVPDFSALMTQLGALPEQIAKSVKEAVGTPKAPTTTEVKPEEKKEESKPTEVKDSKTTTTTPGRKTFRDWWFS